jgi:hypothetical protein
VAQCKLNKAYCGQNGNQGTTCQQKHAQCLQKLENDHPEFFKVFVGCGIFAFICFLLDCLVQYNNYITLTGFGAIQLYRAYPWGEQDSILGIEVLLLACRLFWGKRIIVAPFAQCFFCCTMLFGTDVGFNYFMRQTWSCQAEFICFMLCLGYDAFKTMFRPTPVLSPAAAAPAEQTKETAPTKQESAREEDQLSTDLCVLRKALRGTTEALRGTTEALRGTTVKNPKSGYRCKSPARVKPVQ